MKDDEKRSLASEVGDEELEEGVNDEGLVHNELRKARRAGTYLVEVTDGVDEERGFEGEEGNQ